MWQSSTGLSELAIQLQIKQAPDSPYYDKAKDEKDAYEKLLSEQERLYAQYKRNLRLSLNVLNNN